jgi:hypothetical protein
LRGGRSAATPPAPSVITHRERRGIMSRFTLLYVLLLLPLVCSACTIYIGPYDESSGSGAQLPEPNEGAVDGPLLDEAQRARKGEVDRYILEVIYQGAPSSRRSSSRRAMSLISSTEVRSPPSPMSFRRCPLRRRI